ncbi:LysR substrate-binding domain-containing protein [Pseudomonas kermanshahensis]|jgi:LysR family transcriptional activator of dmlA|uniref:LysR substrate-binding domain-containing protein n=1 Tax=Pseudomonas kermanshahensis TaxID=2745482 RepID=A0ABU8R6V8_9PSED|nr:LysR substrate-binding domain-containing protein [Pseudomonas sp. NBRC 111123]
MNTIHEEAPLPEDLRVFLTVIRKASFGGAAAELQQSPAYVSKRIRILEETLGTKLIHRSTRRIALTESGLRAEQWATRILNDIDDFMGDLSQVRKAPRGLLHICSSFGFGRNYVAPAIADLAVEYPDLEVRMDVFDRVVDIVAEGFDLEIRVGDDIPGQHISRQLVANRRVICATPEYLEKRGVPKTIEDLASHDCLVLKERNNNFGVWQLRNGQKDVAVRVSGQLSSNNGEIVLQWALKNRGLLLRSMWDVKPLLEQGRLVQVLHDYSQSANVWAVYPTRLAESGKLRACVEFLQAWFSRLRAE